MVIAGSMKAIVEIIRQKLSTVNGIVASVAILALLSGVAFGSPVGRIVCGIILFGGALQAAVRFRGTWKGTPREVPGTKEDLYSHPPESDMKKLLFDDFQSSAGKYVVKEIPEQAEKAVVPSSRNIQPVVATREEKKKEFEVSDFFDLDSDMFRSDAEPRSEFRFLLKKALQALKDGIFAHTVAFFWVNREKGQLVLETCVTDSRNLMTAKRLPLEEDVVSQVAIHGKPQLLGNINPVSEGDVVKYYGSPEHVQSVVAVPVYYIKGSGDQMPTGVIVADTQAEDAFGTETMSLLGNYTKLVSALIKSYTDKYDLLLESELLASISRMNDRVKSDPGEVTVLNSLAEEASRLVNWDFLAIAMYGDEQQSWVLQKVVNRGAYPYVTPDQVIDFNASVVGRVIRGNATESIADVSREKPVRFHKLENIDSEGSFMCLPISSMNRCYGALTLESRTKNNFAGTEVETMYRLVENAGLSLEVLYMNDLVKDFVIVDQLTGSFNGKHFLKKLDEEIRRAEDFGQELALASLVIDNPQEMTKRYGGEGFDSMLNQIARIVRGSIRPYDVLGRQDPHGVGVLMINTAASEAYLWAEKIRKQIASHVITIDGKSLSVTVSVGVCGLTEGMQRDDMVAGTSRLLTKAIEDGGNLERVL